MKVPQVSIIMAAYNAERYLREAIDSVLAQTFKDFEFIIVNDGSTDRTGEIAESYKDPRVALKHQKNAGQIPALHRGIKEARGEYLARMDADDISEPARLEKQVEFLGQDQELVLVGCSFQVIDESGALISLDATFPEDEVLRRAFYLRNPLAHGSVLMRRSAYDASGGYREEFAPAEDYDLWCRLAARGKIAAIPQVLYAWRANTQGLSHTRSERSERNARRVRERWWVEYLPNPQPTQLMRQRIGTYAALGGEIGQQLKPRYIDLELAFSGELIKRGHLLDGLRNFLNLLLVGPADWNRLLFRLRQRWGR